MEPSPWTADGRVNYEGRPEIVVDHLRMKHGIVDIVSGSYPGGGKI